MKKNRCFLFIIMATVFLGFVSDAFAEGPKDPKKMRLEGVVYEQEFPETSIAILDGEFVRLGETVGNYVLSEIYPNYVLLTEYGTTNTIRLDLTGPSINTQPAPAPSVSPVSPQKKPGLADWAQFLNPFNAQNRSLELKAFVELKSLFQGAMLYQGQYDKWPQNFQELITADLIDQDFEDGKRGVYEFKMQTTRTGALFFAEPLDKKSALKYLCIDENGKVHAEEGMSATPTSPPYTNDMEQVLNQF